MSPRQLTAFLICCLAAGGITTAKAQWLPRPDPERGSLGVTVRATTMQGSKFPASEVYFVRVEDDEDTFAAEYVMSSSYSEKDQFYLVNARPGRYVVVAAIFVWRKAQSQAPGKVFFSKAMIPQTETKVEPGTIAFMGDFLVTPSPTSRMGDADPAQAHYYRLLSPETADKTFIMQGPWLNYRGVLNQAIRDANRERKFWIRARDKVFKQQQGWAELLRRQLEVLAERGKEAKSQSSPPDSGKEE